jgi:cytochrome c peroxidase
MKFRHTGRRVLTLVLVSLCLLFAGLALSYRWAGFWDNAHATMPAIASAQLIQEPISPIVPLMNLDPQQVALGKQLFHDPRLSHNNRISCASCHDLTKAGTDQLPRSIGILGKLNERNSPTVFNSAFNFRQGWDGQTLTLEDQMNGPITGMSEMGSSWDEIVPKLKRDPQYVRQFRQLYKEGIQAQTIQQAIATYERSLTTPNSRFDQFLKGDQAALTQSEIKGYEQFKSYGCVACHQGTNVGGNMFQSLGVMADYFIGEGKTATKADLGRFNLTGELRDRYVFKVPSLRNVAQTAPYFHDGHVKTLPEAVQLMAKYQLGRSIDAEDIDLIVQFLQTLSAEVSSSKVSSSKVSSSKVSSSKVSPAEAGGDV